ncbi:AAA-like domain-containing protein [Halomicronema sp. CCY15110]|uniref:WD40 domain-containing protein n=1 Tax=Halomicronema sp. CCY15110 TaxID=2767773 RepID=UPI0019525067|nr:AAA-like domain-containing protein [Halomicronema sp. CCY15110]
MASFATQFAESPEMPYQVGGSLRPALPSYVSRQADTQLTAALQAAEFCYVLNSRQMGKSSLLVQTLRKLELAGCRCATVDITSLGSQEVTAGQWYRGLVADLWRGLGLFSQGHYKKWWQDQGELPPVQKLQRFFEEVLLEQYPADVFVILIDEIDNILGLEFSLDDFFALIRYCYNQRAVNPAYRRLTFGIFGVATPSDLIRDRQRTPFNIGQAISLNGFQSHECQPLLIGLGDTIAQAPVVLKEILYWTGGQPFLTHKLCALIWQLAHGQGTPILVSAGKEAAWVKQFVRDRILHQWEAQDEPEHLRTIRDRLLRHPQRTGRLLGLYQQILHQGQIPADDTEEAIELQLAGLVHKVGNTLQVKNPIYQAVFNESWTAYHLAHLRPYSQALTAWLGSDRQDPSRLLRGQALQDAQQWSQDKRLSDEDYQFLAESAERDRHEVQMALEADRSQAIAAQLHQSRRNVRLQRWLLGAITTGFLLSTGLGFAAFVESQRASQNEQIARQSEIRALLASAQGWFDSQQRLDAVLQVLRAQRQLTALKQPDPELAQAIDDTLHTIILGLNEQNRLAGHEGEVRAVAYSPQGDRIASASLDGTVILWTTDGTRLQTLSSNDGGVRAIAFSPDGQVLAAGSPGTIRLWDVPTGEPLMAIPAHQGLITTLGFSPDGSQIASGSTDKTVKVWQRDGTLLHTLTGHRAMVRGLAFSPDGQQLASGSADATIKLWHLADGRLRQTVTGHAATVTDVQFSLDGQRLASSSTDKTLKLWNLAGELLNTFAGHQAPVTDLDFSPDGQQLVSTSEDNELRFWPLNGEPVQTYPGMVEAGRSLDFSPDGQTLVSSGRIDDPAPIVWQLESPLYSVVGNHSAAVIAIAVSPDGQTIASAGTDGLVKLWQPDGTLLKTFPGHRAPIIYLAFSPDGTQFATSSFDGTVRLWRPDGTPMRTITSNARLSGRVAFHPTALEFAISSEDQAVRRLQLDGTQLSAIPTQSRLTSSVAWHPQGTQLAIGDGETIRLMAMAAGSLSLDLSGHESRINDLDFRADGRVLASASDDRTVRLWDVATGETTQVLTGHTDLIWDATFAPESSLAVLNDLYLATGSADNTIKLWSPDGTLHTTLDRHTAKVLRLAFSPDGQYLFSASNDNTVIRWDLPAIMTLDPVDYACQWVADYLQTNADLSEGDRQLCDF